MLIFKSAIAAACMFGIASTAAAQPAPGVADSFFDVFYEIEIGDPPAPPLVPECLPCDYLLDLIHEKEAELNNAKADGNKILNGLEEISNQLKEAEKDLKDAEDELEEFNNPTSWVESGDRRIDSADLDISREHNSELWGQYRSGNMTAQELQDAWETDITDAERERLREKIRKRLEKNVKDAKEERDELKDKQDDFAGKLKAMDEKIKKLMDELAELYAQYEDCIKRCVLGPIDMIDDYGLLPAPEVDIGFFAKLKGFFVNLFGGEEEDDYGLGETVPIELVQLDLTGASPIPVGLPPGGMPGFPADSFFDIFTEITIPEMPPIVIPVIDCPECDPILDQIKKKNEEFDKVEMELDNVLNDLNRIDKDLKQAQRDLDELKARLDRFDNPSGWAESGGRRTDSTDLEIMRAHNRNLWGQYRNGDMTAQELEQAWRDGLSDEEREKLKKKARKDLEKEIKKAEKKVDKLKKEGKDLEKKADDLDAKLDKIADEIDALWDLYDECIKKCVEKGNECDPPLMTQNLCTETCDGSCFLLINVYEEDPGPACYMCYPEIEDKICESPLMTQEVCDAQCDGSCFLSVNVYEPESDVACYECVKKDEPTCPSNLFYESQCKTQCFDKDFDCYMEMNIPDDGIECFACSDPNEPLDECDAPTSEKYECENSCDGECKFSYKTPNDGINCYKCEESVVEPTCPSNLFHESQCKTQCFDKDFDCYMEMDIPEDGIECFACSDPNEPIDECDAPMSEKFECENSCDGECKFSYKTANDEVECYKCYPKITEPEECDAPTMDLTTCEDTCKSNETCDKTYTTNDGLKCYECMPVDELTSCDQSLMPRDTCDSSCDGTCRLMYQSDELDCYECIPDTGPQCPSGSTPDMGICDEQCPGDGVCIEENGCYSCIVVSCPANTYRDAGDCRSSCDGQCAVVGSQYGVDCWGCQLSCEDTCADAGYNPGDTDYGSEILSQLNQYSCVSGADITITTASIGGCDCSRDPVVNVDTTVPICEGTPCGNVSCGSSAECQEGDTIYTVNCGWGGWEQFAPNQFRPVIGN